MNLLQRRLTRLEAWFGPDDPDEHERQFNERDDVYFEYIYPDVDKTMRPYEIAVAVMGARMVGFYDTPPADVRRYSLAELKQIAAEGTTVLVTHYRDMLDGWADIGPNPPTPKRISP